LHKLNIVTMGHHALTLDAMIGVARQRQTGDALGQKYAREILTSDIVTAIEKVKGGLKLSNRDMADMASAVVDVVETRMRH
jgi:hypothetical protein